MHDGCHRERKRRNVCAYPPQPAWCHFEQEQGLVEGQHSLHSIDVKSRMQAQPQCCHLLAAPIPLLQTSDINKTAATVQRRMHERAAYAGQSCALWIPRFSLNTSHILKHTRHVQYSASSMRRLRFSSSTARPGAHAASAILPGLRPGLPPTRSLLHQQMTARYTASAVTASCRTRQNGGCYWRQQCRSETFRARKAYSR
jgi:hypothetical protein